MTPRTRHHLRRAVGVFALPAAFAACAGIALALDPGPRHATAPAPPPPAITAAPSDPTSASSATIAFTDAQAGVHIHCRLDAHEDAPCTSPVTYAGLSLGLHTFTVRAFDAAGHASGATAISWHVVAPAPLTLSGNAAALLYPGAAARTIPLTLHNPGRQGLVVTGVTVALLSTGATRCEPAWFAITPAPVSSLHSLRVPAGASITLPAQGVAAPSIRMLDSHTNQNVCQRATLTLGYTASAHTS